MLRRLLKRLRVFRDTRGTAAVEFALLAPTLFLAMFGVMDFGRMLYTASTLEHIASKGARFAAVNGSASDFPVTEGDVESFVLAEAVGMNLTSDDIDVAWAPSNDPGSLVSVSVTADFQFLMISMLPLGPIELSGTSAMIITY